jgi:hypothetical protein
MVIIGPGTGCQGQWLLWSSVRPTKASTKSAPCGFRIDDIAAQDPVSRLKGWTGVFGPMDEPVHLIDEDAGGRDFLK